MVSEARSCQPKCKITRFCGRRSVLQGHPPALPLDRIAPHLFLSGGRLPLFLLDPLVRGGLPLLLLPAFFGFLLSLLLFLFLFCRFCCASRFQLPRFLCACSLASFSLRTTSCSLLFQALEARFMLYCMMRSAPLPTPNMKSDRSVKKENCSSAQMLILPQTSPNCLSSQKVATVRNGTQEVCSLGDLGFLRPMEAVALDDHHQRQEFRRLPAFASGVVWQLFSGGLRFLGVWTGAFGLGKMESSKTVPTPFRGSISLHNFETIGLLIYVLCPAQRVVQVTWRFGDLNPTKPPGSSPIRGKRGWLWLKVLHPTRHGSLLQKPDRGGC